jgi:hypothetical protein
MFDSLSTLEHFLLTKPDSWLQETLTFTLLDPEEKKLFIPRIKAMAVDPEERTLSNMKVFMVDINKTFQKHAKFAWNQELNKEQTTTEFADLIALEVISHPEEAEEEQDEDCSELGKKRRRCDDRSSE